MTTPGAIVTPGDVPGTRCRGRTATSPPWWLIWKTSGDPTGETRRGGEERQERRARQRTDGADRRRRCWRPVESVEVVVEVPGAKPGSAARRPGSCIVDWICCCVRATDQMRMQSRWPAQGSPSPLAILSAPPVFRRGPGETRRAARSERRRGRASRPSCRTSRRDGARSSSGTACPGRDPVVPLACVLTTHRAVADGEHGGCRTR